MKVITFANQKGGIGKTTSAITMAAMLKERGYRVLLIDADPQRNSTATYKAQSDNVATIYDVMVVKSPTERCKLSEAVQHTDFGDIVASDKLMRQADADLLQDAVGGITRLKRAIKELEAENLYDFVVIDTNPNIDRIMLNALVATNDVIIPTSASVYGAMGLADLYEQIKEIHDECNPSLKIAGILVVDYDGRTVFAKSVHSDLEDIAKTMGTGLFKNAIRSSIKVKESQAMCKPLNEYAPKCNSTIDYEAFVDEYLKSFY